jgi:hypothetical protein
MTDNDDTMRDWICPKCGAAVAVGKDAAGDARVREHEARHAPDRRTIDEKRAEYRKRNTTKPAAGIQAARESFVAGHQPRVIAEKKPSPFELGVKK